MIRIRKDSTNKFTILLCVIVFYMLGFLGDIARAQNQHSHSKEFVGNYAELRKPSLMAGAIVRQQQTIGVVSDTEPA